MAEPSDEIKKQLRQSKIISQIISIAVCALMALFFIVTMNSMTTIQNQVEMLKNGPYPVSVAAGRIDTLLVQSETIAQSAAFVSTPNAAAQMKQLYKDVNSELAEKLIIVKRSDIMGSDFDTIMQAGYNKLVDLEATLMEMCENASITSAETSEFAQSEIIPLLDIMINENSELIDTSTEMVDNVYSSINNALGLNILFSWILIIAVALSVFTFLAILSRKNNREEQLRENLNETVELAQAASAAKSSFLSSMSHDIRTPLNAIVGFTSLARSSIGDATKQLGYIDHIDVASRHLLSLINDILDMSEIESGRIKLNESPFYLSEFINEFTTLVKPLADDKHQKLTISYDIDNDNLLIGDSMRLKQIVLNLASNAVKYTPEEGIISIIFAKEPSDEDGYVNYKITVTDNGIGMSESFLEEIFIPFEREHTDMTISTEGAGLGMAITKNVVDIMGGTIEVKSELGVGSEFTVLLPFKLATETQATLHAMIAPDAEREWNKDAVAIDRKPEKISGRVLLVEDDPLNQEIAVELIRQTGVLVETANDGVEAVSRMKEVEPGYYGMVFMDFRMPRMDGLEATNCITEWESERCIQHTPIIALTANAFNEDRESATQAGMDDFITKPINMGELKRMLRKYLG